MASNNDIRNLWDRIEEVVRENEEEMEAELERYQGLAQRIYNSMVMNNILIDTDEDDDYEDWNMEHGSPEPKEDPGRDVPVPEPCVNTEPPAEVEGRIQTEPPTDIETHNSGPT